MEKLDFEYSRNVVTLIPTPYTFTLPKSVTLTPVPPSGLFEQTVVTNRDLRKHSRDMLLTAVCSVNMWVCPWHVLRLPLLACLCVCGCVWRCVFVCVYLWGKGSGRKKLTIAALKCLPKDPRRPELQLPLFICWLKLTPRESARFWLVDRQEGISDNVRRQRWNTQVCKEFFRVAFTRGRGRLMLGLTPEHKLFQEGSHVLMLVTQQMIFSKRLFW